MRCSIPFEVYGSATSCLITEESPAPTVITIIPTAITRYVAMLKSARTKSLTFCHSVFLSGTFNKFVSGDVGAFPP